MMTSDRRGSRAASFIASKAIVIAARPVEYNHALSRFAVVSRPALKRPTDEAEIPRIPPTSRSPKDNLVPAGATKFIRKRPIRE